jgi:hypothetical protein
LQQQYKHQLLVVATSYTATALKQLLVTEATATALKTTTSSGELPAIAINTNNKQKSRKQIPSAELLLQWRKKSLAVDSSVPVL